MKLTVKTLKGTHFEIRVQHSDTIMAVKKKIEEIQGKDSYPWGQQLLIHNGKVLKDESTLDENEVSEVGFLVVMLSKSKASASSGTSSAQPSSTPVTRQAPPVAQPQAPQPLVPATTTSQPERLSAETPSSIVDHAASDLLSGSNVETMINQIMEMGGGSWDRDKVQRALRAAYNNPERAIDYLYSGIPVSAEVAVPVVGQGANTTDAAPSGFTGLSGIPNTAPLDLFPQGIPVSAEVAVPVVGQGANTTDAAPSGFTGLSGIPNTAPLDLFPQGASNAGGAGGGGSLDFLRNNQQFQALREMVHTNPQILQPMLQELSKQNPQLRRLIQENNEEFLQLLEGGDGDLLDQPDQDEMPHAISVTPEEQEAIGRLEAMGFDRARVIEAFFACDRNEQLAVNYLLEHAGDED